MSGNYYFKDRDGNELKDHPLNGIPANGAGSGVATDGTMKCDGTSAPLWRDKHGRIARVSITGFTMYRTGKKEYPEITIDDFDGHTAVLVKAWYPRTEFNEEFWLIGPDGCAKIAEQTLLKARDKYSDLDDWLAVDDIDTKLQILRKKGLECLTQL